MNPVLTYDAEKDNSLIKEAVNGSKSALEELVKEHYTFIYNLAFRFVFNHTDAEDLTQEVIIKVITHLSQFSFKAGFRTWLYRIVLNHFLNTRKFKVENEIRSFNDYGKDLEKIPCADLNEIEISEKREVIEEARIGCMTGMLLCLERKQRLTYILGEIFDIDSITGSKLLDISAANYRQQLSRARKSLYNFMNNKCGLINTQNPCRCRKKVKGFIQAGYIDENNMEFNNHFVLRISDIATKKADQFSSLLDKKYSALFKDHPYYDRDNTTMLINRLIKEDMDIKSIFNADEVDNEGI